LSAPDHSFLTIIHNRCAKTAGWIVESGAYADDPWIRATNSNSPALKQGWKLHVSASDRSAEQVLERALPILLEQNASFKIICSVSILVSLNEGEFGLSQIGKFLTIYPNDDAQAVRLAIALDQQTRGLHGIRVPSDRQLAPNSLIHYRYGGFDDSFIQTPLGEILPSITTTEGDIRVDHRGLAYEQPTWIPDPFEVAGIAEPMRKPARLVAQRYLIISRFYDGVRGSVYHAVDIETPQPCILKRATSEIGVVSGEDSTQVRLTNEAAVLAKLAPDDRFPRLIQLVKHDGDLYLAEHEFEGLTLEQYVRDLANGGRTLSTQQFLEWGCEIARMLATVHAHGFVYHDLKSANVIVCRDGRLRLIDFDCVRPIGSSDVFIGRGTPGYSSPQQYAGCRSAVADDIYSLGALLYFMATNAEPSLSPRGAMLGKRSLRKLNGAMSNDIGLLVAKCLRTEPNERYSSATEVETELGSIASTATVNGSGAERGRCDRHLYSKLARRLADTLCNAAEPTPGFDGVGWKSTHDGDPVWAHDLAIGSAGCLLGFAELVQMFGGKHRYLVLRKAAAWLACAAPFAEPPLPGLYVGEAGVGSALLRASQVLNDSQLFETAARKSCLVAAMPYSCPDLYNGTAGRLRFHLLVWDATGTSDHLSNAISAGENLLGCATISGDDAFWVLPPGYESLSGTANLGYAHGAAGIADTLLDLFEATGEERFFEVARRAAHWLSRLASPTLNDGGGFSWPIDLDGEPFGPLWCHGAAGIGRFLIHAAQLGVSQECWELARRAAAMVFQGGRWAGPTQCHGLAGNIEFLIDMFQATGEKQYLTQAYDLASILEAFAIDDGGRLSWQSETPGVVTPDYLVGYAGIAVCLLRLSCPHRMPHQLSRRGFQWSAAKSTREGERLQAIL
jgi:hypothetical protein